MSDSSDSSNISYEEEISSYNSGDEESPIEENNKHLIIQALHDIETIHESLTMRRKAQTCLKNFHKEVAMSRSFEEAYPKFQKQRREIYIKNQLVKIVRDGDPKLKDKALLALDYFKEKPRGVHDYQEPLSYLYLGGNDE